MDLSKTLSSEKSIFIISFLWGMAIAVLLMRKCMDGYCVVVKGPEKNDIEGKVFKVDDKCYEFEPKIAECKKNDLPIKSDLKKDDLF